MASPRVTVVIPCYNQARYLPEALQSVVAQTEERWECVIVDDGSPDDTAGVAAELIARHPGRAIRLLRQPNRGLPGARNAGIAAGSAPYVLPLDADDALEPEMLERTAALLDAHPQVGFVYTDVVLFGEERGVWSGGAYSLEKLRFDCPMVPATLFRRRAWEQAGGFDEDMRDGYEDWSFWLSLAEAGWEGLHLPQPLVRYRRSPRSMLTAAHRRDLQLRARVFLSHPRLYEPAFLAWAAGASSRPRAAAAGGAVPIFLTYLAALALHRPRLLPKALLRPLYMALPVRWQGRARGMLRALRRYARP
nr:MAG: glycosyltransferase family 2 protein [Chloroflexota bacterium]